MHFTSDITKGDFDKIEGGPFEVKKNSKKSHSPKKLKEETLQICTKK